MKMRLALVGLIAGMVLSFAAQAAQGDWLGRARV